MIMGITIKRPSKKGYQATARYKVTFGNGNVRWRLLTPLSADRLSQRVEVKSVERDPLTAAKPEKQPRRTRKPTSSEKE